MTSNTIPAVLEAIHQSPRKPRKGSHYTEEEKAIFCKYRDEYKATTSHDERKALLHSALLVDIFQYWLKKEKVIPPPDEVSKRVKVHLPHSLSSQ